MRIDNVDDLLAVVRNTGRRVYQTAFNEAVTASRLNGLINIRAIGVEDTDFSYTPRLRHYTMGDASPATCGSKPMYVEEAGTEPQWGRCEEHELAYKVCIKDCRSEDASVIVRNKERQVADGLMSHLWRKLWFGNPQRLQYGLLNHPLLAVVNAPTTGTGSSSNWKDKTNSQVMQEIRQYIKYMVTPKIIISESVYNNAMGTANTTATGTESSCALRLDCIVRMLRDQPDINLAADSITFMAELDNVSQFSNLGVALIYDAAGMVLTSSGPIYTAATVISSKEVEAIRSVNTGGLQIDYTNSAYVLKGI